MPTAPPPAMIAGLEARGTKPEDVAAIVTVGVLVVIVVAVAVLVSTFISVVGPAVTVRVVVDAVFVVRYSHKYAI